MEKKDFLIVILIGIILIVGGFYVNHKMNVSKQIEENQNIEWGYQQAIIEIMSIAVKCETIPLSAGNVSINLVAVECLQEQ